MQQRARRHLSRLRQTLVQLKDQPGHLLPIFLEDSPMVKGNVYPLRRKCGKAYCRCVEGQPHVTLVHSTNVEGRTRLWTVPKERIEELHLLTGRYRRFRSARAKFVKLYVAMLRTINAIEQVRKKEP
ncbi:hypothetical protein HY968_05085 [Candidatus Kaiserbacteria bacterium]|nr:hypothetical protein [Candidatus Kaiserbacteria bacterium]